MREATPTAQIQDSAAEFGLTVRHQAGEALYQPDMATVPNPGYDRAARSFGVDVRMPAFSIDPHDQRLHSFAGLRVLAGVQTRDGHPVYLPGIVLPPAADAVTRIGCLQGPDALRPDDLQQAAGRPLSDLQQVYLEQMAAMHAQGVGEHSGSRVNVADIGHAALIASTGINQAAGIENRVHDYVRGGLSQSIARTGALSLQVGHDVRHIKEVVLPARQAAHLVVSRHHQMPSSVQLPAASLAVGVTLAAVRSKRGSYPQPDLTANTYAMIAGR